MEKIPEFKYHQPGNKFLFDDTFRNFCTILNKKERTWTELKKEVGLRDPELKRILIIAKKERIVLKKNNKYYLSPSGASPIMLRNGMLSVICKTNNAYQNYDLQDKTFFSGIKQDEVDKFILDKSAKIKNIHREVKNYLFKKRRKEFDKAFEVELKKIKSADAKVFLKCNKLTIFKRIYGNHELYKRGEDLFFIAFLPYCFFMEIAKRQDLLSKDIVKIETFNLFYGLFDKILFPEIFILPDTKMEGITIKKDKFSPLDYEELQKFLLKNKSLLRL
jgi:hypothetical protein